MYRIEFKKSAQREFSSLPEVIKRKIIEALNLLSKNPYSELLQIKKLKGLDSVFRFRINDYRIIYAVDGDRLTVIVIKVGHRSEVYR